MSALSSCGSYSSICRCGNGASSAIGSRYLMVSRIGPRHRQSSAARNVKTLVHAAWDMRANSLKEMEKTCVQGSAALFDAAVSAEVERIVFVSSITLLRAAVPHTGKPNSCRETAPGKQRHYLSFWAGLWRQAGRRLRRHPAAGTKQPHFANDRKRACPAISVVRENAGESTLRAVCANLIMCTPRRSLLRIRRHGDFAIL